MSNNNKAVNNDSLKTGMGMVVQKQINNMPSHYVQNTVHKSTITNTVTMQISQLIADHVTNTNTCQK